LQAVNKVVRRWVATRWSAVRHHRSTAWGQAGQGRAGTAGRTPSNRASPPAYRSPVTGERPADPRPCPARHGPAPARRGGRANGSEGAGGGRAIRSTINRWIETNNNVVVISASLCERRHRRRHRRRARVCASLTLNTD